MSVKEAFFNYYLELMDHAMRYVKDKYTANVIVRGAYRDLWENGHEFSDPTTLGKLRRTIYYDCMDHFRDLQSARENEQEFGLWVLGQDNFDQDYLSVPEVVEGELLQKLRTALEKLTPREKLVIHEWMHSGKRAKDIARELGIRENTFSTIKNNALDKLRLLMRRRESIILLLIRFFLNDSWKN